MKRRILSLLLASMLVMVFFLTGCNGSDYKNAVSLYESGQYEEAIAAFEALGDYKDSADRIVACQLGMAADLLSAGDIKAAAEKYTEVFNANSSEEAAEGLVSCIAAQSETDLNAASEMYKVVPEGAKTDSFKFIGGEMLLRLGRLNDAKTAYESVPADFEYNGIKAADRLALLNDHSDLLSICGEWETSKDGTVTIRSTHDSTGQWDEWSVDISGTTMTVLCPYDIDKEAFSINGTATYGYIKNFAVNSSNLQAGQATAAFSVDGDKLPEALPTGNENVTLKYNGSAFLLDFSVVDDSSNLYFTYTSNGSYTIDTLKTPW